MYRSTLPALILSLALLCPTAWAAPREFSDDFTTVATWDSASLLAPCYGGQSTKYTMVEGTTGDIGNEQAVSGGGEWVFTNRARTGLLGRLELGVIGAVNFNQPCPDVAGLSFGETTQPFTSTDVCAYAGAVFSPFQLRISSFEPSEITGPDGQPGIAGIDDDQDGVTDEMDESPAARATAVNNGYGNSDGTGFWAGQDGAPGVAGTDDDGNGTTDEYGETGAAGSDDGDDAYYHDIWTVFRANINTSSLVNLETDVSITSNQFNLRELISGGQDNVLERANEITSSTFFDPQVHYNWAFCVSGTCYGAVLWTEADMANPDELLGPLTNSLHNNPDDNAFGFGSYQNSQPFEQYIRRNRMRGNTNFSNTYWVVSGDPTLFSPSVSSDLDGDRDVDGQDFLTFSVCYNGSLKSPQPACANTDADLDADGDVDGQDFLTFSTCYNGALRRPRPACFPVDLTGCP